jgi:hypothetical protein
MNDNVVSFDEFDTRRQIEAHQAGLPRVILEGASDVRLFRDVWFTDYLERMDFIEAGKVGPGSGCTGVPAAVEISRDQDGVPAVGIVDRDALFRAQQWDLMFTTDDDRFEREAQRPLLFTTTRWEVEAYLFEPELLSDWVLGSHKPPPGSPQACAAALPKAIHECEHLLRAKPYLAALHVAGRECKLKQFVHLSGGDMVAECDTAVAAMSPAERAPADIVRALSLAILAQAPQEQGARLSWLLRYVDTKRLIVRLTSALNVHEDSHWQLAPIMLRAGRRPAELERYLTLAEASFAA